MSEEVPVGRLVSIIVSVLAAGLLLSLAGLVVLRGAGGEMRRWRRPLTQSSKRCSGVFVGVAAGRLASDE
ncbi:MAG: hypothetical protein IPH65_17580 [Dehalococcoidia bacterium]|uniref:hypothetical protein n=1 Tax=Candidatus Amarobacter glycogenicus TaxID=3140699 RepID=UPI003135D7A7|nr:hypothetical protein [Dehalococcoidia bacterium]